MSDPTGHLPETPRARPEAIAQAGRLGRLIEKGGIVFAIGIFLAMLILIQEVFLRYVLNSPTSWAHETTVFLCAVAFIYGGLYCAARDTHIRVVILYDFVSPRVRRVLDIVISVVCALSAFAFAWASWSMVKRAVFRPDGSLYMETSGSAWNPPTPAMLKLFLFAGMIVLTIQFLILAYNYARGERGRQAPDAEQGDC
ncbi:TRAP transporter small permease [Granulosicoccaceae sp. 1_MG-2023]|nr:TRAP transporter small permease [Granulosicoccaceae sp. 1_MG-2023]